MVQLDYIPTHLGIQDWLSKTHPQIQSPECDLAVTAPRSLFSPLVLFFFVSLRCENDEFETSPAPGPHLGNHSCYPLYQVESSRAV